MASARCNTDGGPLRTKGQGWPPNQQEGDDLRKQEERLKRRTPEFASCIQASMRRTPDNKTPAGPRRSNSLTVRWLQYGAPSLHGHGPRKREDRALLYAATRTRNIKD